MKRAVRFAASFTDAVAQGLGNLPNGTVKNSEHVVLIGETGYVITIDPPLLTQLSHIHQRIIDPNNRENMRFFFTARLGDIERVITMERDDLAVLFFTVDKIMAGAEAVTLDGELDITEAKRYTVVQK